MSDRDPDVAGWLGATETPPHGHEFWSGVEAAVDVVALLRGVEPPAHRAGFWEALDARLNAESAGPARSVADAVAPGRSVFVDSEDSVTTGVHHRRPGRRPRRRPRTGVVAAAASVVLVVAAGAAVASRGSDRRDAATPSTSTVTTVAPPTSTGSTTSTVPVPPAASRLAGPQGSVPVGASPDGKYLYMTGPAEGERCALAGGQSTAAVALYAQPVAGGDPHRILTDRVFGEPRLVPGPFDKVVLSDACGPTVQTLITSVEANGALTVDRSVSSPSVALTPDGVAWTADGSGLFLKGASGWYRYDVATASLRAATDIPGDAVAVQQLSSTQLVTVRDNRASAAWTVAVDGRDVAAVSVVPRADPARAVGVDSAHARLAVAGRDKLVVMWAGPAASVATYDYAAGAIAWSADGTNLVAAPRSGGLYVLSFGTASTPLQPSSLGFDGVAYSVLALPATPALVVREARGSGDDLVGGPALLLQPASR